MIGSTNPATSLTNAQTRLFKTIQSLSSGSSINSAADNPAGMAQSASYSVQLSGDAQAINNIQDGISLLDTASGAFDQITQGLQDMRALAIQAGDGALSASDLQSIQEQIAQFGQGIDQIASNTQFNGLNLLDGSFGSISLQTGPNAGDTQSLSLGSASGATLGISDINITSASGQTNAISTLDNALLQVSSQKANIASLQGGLNSTISNLSTSYENLAATKSQVSDTDYAKASSSFAQANAQQAASVRALAMYNATQNNLLALLPK